MSQNTLPTEDMVGLKRSPFEEPFLGGPVYRLMEPLQAVQAAAHLRVQTAALCMARIPVQDEDAARELERAGFRHVETLVTLEKPVSPLGIQSPSREDVCVRRVTEMDIARCSEIAATALVQDRFRTDSAIPDEAAKAIKAAWICNAIQGRAESVWVVKEGEGAVVGFCAIIRRDKAAAIDLIAVDPGFHGKGYGRMLVEAGESSIMGAATALHVGTQLTNKQSLGFYRSLGFLEAGLKQTWHWTPKTH